MQKKKVMIFTVMFLMLVGLVSGDCVDSDGGFDPFVYGMVHDSSKRSVTPFGRYIDYCQGSATIVEYYCSDNTVHSRMKSYFPDQFSCIDGEIRYNSDLIGLEVQVVDFDSEEVVNEEVVDEEVDIPYKANFQYMKEVVVSRVSGFITRFNEFVSSLLLSVVGD